MVRNEKGLWVKVADDSGELDAPNPETVSKVPCSEHTREKPSQTQDGELTSLYLGLAPPRPLFPFHSLSLPVSPPMISVPVCPCVWSELGRWA